MRKLLFIAGAAGLVLISASPPPSDDGTGRSTAHGDESTAVLADSDAGPPAARESGPRPTARVGYYPPCTAARQDRCTQADGRGHAYAGRSHARSRKMQLAMRAGERG